MVKSLHIASALLTVTLIPQTVGAQRVSFDYDRKANFARLRTFALKLEKTSDNPLLTERIAVSINTILSARGLTRADQADMYVVPDLTSETRKEVTYFDPWYGSFGWYGGPYGWYGSYNPYGWNWGGSWSYLAHDVEYATLTIDMLDGQTGSLLWRGKGTREVDDDWKPSKIDKKVYKLVSKVLSNFPPHAGH